MNTAQKITNCLWFDKQAEEAMNFYVSIFSASPGKHADSRILSITRYQKGMDTPGMPEMEGKVLTGVFELHGQRFICLDGGPVFKFNEALSMEVACEDQREIDYFWEKLSAFPESEQCGWLKDKFGVSWQIVPRQLYELMKDPDPAKVVRGMNLLLPMKKIILKEFENL